MPHEASPFLLVSVVLFVISALVGPIGLIARRSKISDEPSAREVADVCAAIACATTIVGTLSLIAEVVVSPIILKEAFIAIAIIVAILAVGVSGSFLLLKRAMNDASVQAAKAAE